VASGEKKDRVPRHLIFRSPPHHPDARDVYLGGCGVITFVRGLLYLVNAPQGAVFHQVGELFIDVWSWIWVIGGAFTVLVACTGHKWPELDRYAAFLLMMIWWVWGGLYLLSATIDSDRRSADFYSGLTLIFTGIVLSAGVILAIRKTQEISLRMVAVGRIRELEAINEALVEENERLRISCDKGGKPDGN
jgi:hypothetical protein